MNKEMVFVKSNETDTITREEHNAIIERVNGKKKELEAKVKYPKFGYLLLVVVYLLLAFYAKEIYEIIFTVCGVIASNLFAPSENPKLDIINLHIFCSLVMIHFIVFTPWAFAEIYQNKARQKLLLTDYFKEVQDWPIERFAFYIEDIFEKNANKFEEAFAVKIVGVDTEHEKVSIENLDTKQQSVVSFSYLQKEFSWLI